MLDLDRFDRLLAEGRASLAAGEPLAAADTLREALALWRGPPLADLQYEPFAQAEIARLEELRLAALEERLEADLACGRHAELAGELEALARDHPLRERLHGQLMLALYRAGRQADALEAYRRARTTLVEELGLEPTRRLQELEAAILRQDPDLEAPPLAAPRRLVAVPRGLRGRRLIVAGGALVLVAALSAALVELVADDPAVSPAVLPDSVAVIDPRTNAVVASLPVGSDPSSIAVGEGAVWVVNGSDRTLSRIDPRTRSVRTIATDATPTDVAAGEGAVWVANGLDDSVSRLDPRSLLIEETIALPPPRRRSKFRDRGPSSVAVAAGSVWVAPSFRGLVWRIDPERKAVVATIRPGGGKLRTGVGTDIASAGRDVWVAGDGAFMIDAGTNSIRATIDVPVLRGHVAAGREAAWISARFGGTVWHISRGGTAITPAGAITFPGGAAGLALGYGSLWVANDGGGTVSRVDPKTRQVLATIRLGGSPSDVAADEGFVWVAVR